MRRTMTLATLAAGLTLSLAGPADAQVSVNLGNPYNGGWTVGNSGGRWYATPAYANPYTTGYGYNNPQAYTNPPNTTGYNQGYNYGQGWNGNRGLTATQYSSGYAGYSQPTTTSGYNTRYTYPRPAYNYGYSYPTYNYGYSYPASGYGWSNAYNGGYAPSYGWRQ